jgi:hypothetical protein
VHRLQPSPAGYRLLEMVTTSSAVRSGDHARIAACCAAAYVALCAVSRGRPPSAERQAFREVNRRQDRTWLRVPQQLGTPWALPSAAGALLLAGRRRGGDGGRAVRRGRIPRTADQGSLTRWRALTVAVLPAASLVRAMVTTLRAALVVRSSRTFFRATRTEKVRDVPAGIA